MCRVQEEGAVAIANFVKQGKKLTELNLYMNDIGDTGAYKVGLHSFKGQKPQPDFRSLDLNLWSGNSYFYGILLK